MYAAANAILGNLVKGDASSRSWRPGPWPWWSANGRPTKDFEANPTADTAFLIR